MGPQRVSAPVERGIGGFAGRGTRRHCRVQPLAGSGGARWRGSTGGRYTAQAATFRSAPGPAHAAIVYALRSEGEAVPRLAPIVPADPGRSRLGGLKTASAIPD